MNRTKNKVWKPISEAWYVVVNSDSVVRTLDRWVPTKGNGKRLAKGHILKQRLINSGYMVVYFRKNGKLVGRLVHRLVAEAFLPNPNNLPQVNHKDCDRTNNNVDNLEWCTISYNSRYREKYGVSAAESQGHFTYAVNLETLEVLKFKSQIEASRALGVGVGNINNVIKGKRKTLHGYWFTEDGNRDTKISKSELHNLVARKPQGYHVIAIDLNASEILRFKSQREAAKSLGISGGNINKVLKNKRSQASGYWFTKADRNAVEVVRAKFGDSMADKVEELMKDIETQSA